MPRGLNQTVRNPQLGQRTLAGRTPFNRQSVNRALVRHNLVTQATASGARASMLRNNTYASLATRPGMTALAQARFQGRLAGQHWRHHHHGWHWRHHHPIVVVGWYGSLFWPYAYWDFVDYTFWPYAYDSFWPYAYDDLYVGLFGPYAYEGPAYASAPHAPRSARAAAPPDPAPSVVCSERAPELAGWPMQQIAQAVEPDQAQQGALNELKDATTKTVDLLQSECPDELPSTPPGRLGAMRKRIATMQLALSMVQLPLQRFYDSLNDEQKARFNVIAPNAQPARIAHDSQRPPDLAHVCSMQAVRSTDVPTERIALSINPTEAQRGSLDALNEATTKAADFLKANCPKDENLTPPGRVSAMHQRLNAMLEAIRIVQPALDSFYRSLTDEQKARFNKLALGGS